MSTTADLKIALKYSQGEVDSESLLLWLRTDNFMDRGVDLSWLSAFPHEKEYLYPPLTYLKPIHQEPKAIDIGGRKYQIVDLKATME